tara:strand:+ start:804 stop:1088 length:285 start_codon:yes stop_codon:yes gene_type:complete
MIRSIRNRIFDNLKNYTRPNEVEYTATQLKAFEILNRPVPKKLSASQQKAHDILNKPKLTLAQMKARRVLDKPIISDAELLEKCLAVFTRSNEL